MANTMTFTLAGEDRLTSKFKQAGKAASTFRATLVGVGTALAGTAVIRGIFNFGKSSVQAFTEAEQAQTKLQFAYQKFPRLANQNITALREYNTALAKTVKYDDDAIAAGQATLAQFRLTGKQIKDTTPLLLDYASASGKDVPSAASAIGKALMGNTKALKTIGINYKSTGSATKDYANITDLLRAKVGGFATKEGATAAGRLEILKNQFGELQEAVGERLVPALSWLTRTGLGVIQWLDANSSKLTPFWQGLQRAGGTARDELVPALGEVGKFLKGPVWSGLVTVGGFIKSDVIPALQQFGGFVRDDVAPALDKLATGALRQGADAFGKIRDVVRENGPQFKDAAGTVLGLATNIGEKLLPAAKFLGENALPAVTTAVSGVIDVVGTVTKAIQDHETTAKVVAGVLISVFVPGWVATGVAAAASGVAQVGAWVASSTAGTRAAILHSVNTVKTVGGWVAMGLAATRSGATSAAIWLLYASDGVKAAALHLVNAGRVVGGWVLMGAAATKQAAFAVAGWVAMGISGAAGAGTQVLAAGRVVGAWVLMGVQGLINAAKMAAAWLIAMGPVGWVILGLGLVGLAFVALWKKSETFRDIVTGVWKGIKDVTMTAVTFVVKQFLGFAGGIVGAAEKAFGWVPGIGPKLKTANAEFKKFADDVNGKLAGINDQQVSITMKYTNTGVNLTAPSSVGRSWTGGPGGVHSGAGPVRGPGTGLDDRAGLWALSHGEHVWTASEVRAAGGHDAVKAMRATVLAQGKRLAKGGPASFDVTRAGPTAAQLASNSVLAMRELVKKVAAQAAKGGNLQGTVSWLKSQVGKPYLWGGSGPAGYDCSGLVSAAINKAFGRNPHQRLGATGSMPWPMFAPGAGRVMVGWFKGNPGHTAMTIGGINAESRGGRGVLLGPSARGANDPLFTNRMRVKGLAGGGPAEGRYGDAPFDLLRGNKKLRNMLGYKVFDDGGMLMPGEFGFNGTRHPEPVLNTGGKGVIDYERLAGILIAAAKEARPIDVKQTYPESGNPKAAAEAGAQRLVSLLGDL